MDQLRAMRTFVAVAESGSLSAAARRAGMPLTTVSRLLTTLEEHVGIALIARTTRRLALTDAGVDYLAACRRALDEIETAENRIAGRKSEPAGELTLTAPVVCGRLHVLPVLNNFLKKYPRVDARLILSDRIVDLTEHAVDVAVRVGQLPDSNLIAARVGAFRLIACAAPSYLKKRSRITQPGDLDSHDCIIFSPLAGGNRWTFKSKAHGQTSVRIQPRLSVNTAEAAIDAAISGVGVTRVLSYQAKDAIDRKRLAIVLAPFDDGLIPVHLVHRGNKLPKPLVPLFLAFATRELRHRLELAMPRALT